MAKKSAARKAVLRGAIAYRQLKNLGREAYILALRVSMAKKGRTPDEIRTLQSEIDATRDIIDQANTEILEIRTKLGE